MNRRVNDQRNVWTIFGCYVGMVLILFVIDYLILSAGVFSFGWTYSLTAYVVKYVLTIAFNGVGLVVVDIIIMYSVIEDLNTICGAVEEYDDDKPFGIGGFILLNFVTCDIYRKFWFFKQGNRLKRCAKGYGLEISEGGGSYLVWAIFFPVIALVLFIGNLNKVCKAYNKCYDSGRKPGMINGQGVVPGVSVNPPYQPGGQVNPPYQPGGQVNPPYQPGGQVNTPYSPGGSRNDSSTYGLFGDTNGAGQGKIQFIEGQYKGNSIKINANGRITMGRNGQKCQLVFANPVISNLHCEVSFMGGRESAYYVTDHSSNGTFLNKSIRLEKGKATRCPIGSIISLAGGTEIFQLM